MKKIETKELIVPEHPHQCIKCELNFHLKGYKFVINPKHKCWYNKETEREVEQLEFCPECGGSLDQDLDTDDMYCPNCGLITSSHSDYVAGIKIILPYGKR